MKQQFTLSQAGRMAAVIAAGFIATAHATPKATLYGGGATLPGVFYVGTTDAHPDGGATQPRLSVTSDGLQGTALFGAEVSLYTTLDAVYSALPVPPAISYCQTGSGAGKRVLAGITASAANLVCPTFGTSVPTNAGFSAAGTQTDPDFVGSDAPLSQSEYTSYITNKNTAHTEPVQIPVVAGAIGLGYNQSSFTGLLTDKDICLIFSRQVTDWHSALLSHPIATSTPINVVVRSDGSGTTFSFANHLATVCTAAVLGSGHGNFVTDQAWSNVIKSIVPAITVANFDPKSGNPGVAGEILAVANSVGYGEAANFKNGSTVKQAKVQASGGTKFLDPLADLPATTATLSLVLALPDQAISTTTNADGTPALAALTGTPTNFVPGCVNLVDPATYGNFTTTYPIIGVTNLLANYSGNGDDAPNIGRLLTAAYDPSITSGLGVAGAGSGFSLISGLLDSGGNTLDAHDISLTVASKCVHS